MAGPSIRLPDHCPTLIPAVTLACLASAPHTHLGDRQQQLAAATGMGLGGNMHACRHRLPELHGDLDHPDCSGNTSAAAFLFDEKAFVSGVFSF